LRGTQDITTGDPSRAAALGELVVKDSRARGIGRVLGRLFDLPHLGGWLARATRAPNTVRPVSTRISRLHGWVLRITRGRLRRSWLFAAGQPVLALTTTGRKSGQRRTTAVSCFTDGPDLALAAMNLGLPRDPAWARNLEANPEATIELRGEKIDVHARRATGPEAERLWRRWVEVQPSAEAMRELSGRDIPLFVVRRR